MERHPEWARAAPGLKSVEDALEIRRRLLTAYEEAEREADPERQGEGVRARVAPEMVGVDSPMYGVEGTTSIVQFESDVLGLLSVIEANPGPDTTAYGLLADFINAVKLR